MDVLHIFNKSREFMKITSQVAPEEDIVLLYVGSI